MLRRLFNIILSILGLAVCLPLFLCLILLSSIDTRAFGLFRLVRIGKNGKPFTMYKIRSMKPTDSKQSNVVTNNNPNITSFGHFLRKTKLDELPQLWNVLIGNMSFVGPRPDVPGYADQLQGDDKIILTVRPGITGPASLAFRDEEELLAEQDDPQRYNDEVIWPEKVRINKEYIRNYSLLKDIKLIFKTVLE